MRLTYIYHSCYTIEAANFTMIIDYYKDSINESQGVIHDRILHRPYPLYVLVSHGHHDHFNPEILKWKEQRSDIRYIFSEDLRSLLEGDTEDIYFMSKDDIYNDDLITVHAYGSTDLGISFKIIRGTNVLFHAGDLNNWHWNEESTDKEIEEAEDFYMKELNHISDSTPHVGLAMFPVDPRLGKDYLKGAEQFLSKIETRLIAPMHFDMEYEKAAALEKVAAKFGAEAFIPRKRGEIYTGEV
ncbi:MBL fold metallo-hydrolase [Dysgonomonas macrotermitis]|uniref:L-ascorbate metabolism protein UlaG, beta-lactamase superfamily n=1 Tax=Dysgonomonas macrotermitis TaxID=1346286 RepID=A0A1M5F841_9BACT|nr:MBL fold metallo-hydrolase [Dysgonomonas macrotermitis]SHF87241.1 L-ascorbate metabolism protein UlaG, beta-lactamase superfamily [Dysgonomonas macrotermitis]